MKYYWDLFRWRFIALAGILAWWFSGAPMKDQPKPTRWQNTKFAWRCWRDIIMYPHERERYKSLSELVAFYKSTNKWIIEEESDK